MRDHSRVNGRARRAVLTFVLRSGPVPLLCTRQSTQFVEERILPMLRGSDHLCKASSHTRNLGLRKRQRYRKAKGSERSFAMDTKLIPAPDGTRAR